MSQLSDLINLDLPDSTDKIIAEYIWTDGCSMVMRSKAMTVPRDEFPKWIYDDSRTCQTSAENGVVELVPQVTFMDPFRRGKNILVLCKLAPIVNMTILTNKRGPASSIFRSCAVGEEEPWFSIVQEYTLLLKDVPSHQELNYSFGIGADKSFGRDIVESHYKACLYAGIDIGGINGKLMPGQWEFQIGPADGISVGDQWLVARYILERITEIAGVLVSFDPKPVPGDWNSGGTHIDYSTKSLREGRDHIEETEKIIKKLHEWRKKRTAAHAKGNEQTLTGEQNILANYTEWPISWAGVKHGRYRQPIRIGWEILDEQGKECFQGGIMDPYAVTSLIAENTLSC